MPTQTVPYVPPAATPTTTTAPVYPSTTPAPCVPTSPPLSLKARKSGIIRIPRIGFNSPVGAASQFTNLTIVTIPATGTLKNGSTTLANTNTVPLADLDKLTYTAPSDFAGATFVFKIVTSCGETANVTATIALEDDPIKSCAGCPSTTVAP